VTMERSELAAWLRLEMTFGIGPVAARKLLAAFGLPQHIFTQPRTALIEVVSAKQADALMALPQACEARVDATLSWLSADAPSRRVLTLGDHHYPAGLLEMEDPPLLLYAMGSAAIWEGSGWNDPAVRAMAVVGSRNPTAQGIVNARQFSESLAQGGFTIVSGLALGIDGAAHEGALSGASAGQIATVAVVGTGLDRVYPSQHRDLAHRIAQRGLLLSEYPLGTAPLSANFPKRNRIISGLAQGTLVVEAALKSGSLITARLALEQGKDVFAIPGSIHSTQARGCHSLIKQGAKLVESADDVLEEITSNFQRPGTSAAFAELDLSDGEGSDPVWSALGYDPVGLDALLARTGLDTARLQVRLMELELEGRVTRLPGGLFQRLVLA
jgi:DNA processing protein